jgi:RNA-directed DNA polymerase
MKIFEPHKEEILKKLKEGGTIADLVNILNFLIDIQNSNGSKYQHLSHKRVTYYYFNLQQKYHEFNIPKKSGGERQIKAPDRFLLKIQRRINILLYLLFTPSQQAHGFLLGRSIKSNALPHMQKKFVLNMDIADFFPSVSFFRVHTAFQLKPFEAKKPFAHIIANFCCVNGYLPQGAPTSPMITNIICERLDRKLNSQCRNLNLTYTRYADDMTFSSDENFGIKKFIAKITNLALQEGFVIKRNKTRMLTPNMRQEVTGLVVNRKVNVNRKFIHNLRAMIEYAKKDVSMASNTPNIISGKLLFLRMIRGEDDIYRKLKDKFLSI